MNARTQNVSIAKETLSIILKEAYTAPNGQTVDLSQAIDFCRDGSVLYKSDHDFNDYSEWETFVPTIEVVNETTAQAAARLLNEGKTNLVALNFASGVHVG